MHVRGVVSELREMDVCVQGVSGVREVIVCVSDVSVDMDGLRERVVMCENTKKCECEKKNEQIDVEGRDFEEGSV